VGFGLGLGFGFGLRGGRGSAGTVPIARSRVCWIDSGEDVTCSRTAAGAAGADELPRAMKKAAAKRASARSAATRSRVCVPPIAIG